MKKQQLFCKWITLSVLLLFAVPVLAQFENSGSNGQFAIWRTKNPVSDLKFSKNKMLWIDIAQIYNIPLSRKAELAELQSGGIIADIGNNGEVRLNVYFYDEDKPGGKGSLIYQCYTKERNVKNDRKSYSYTHEVTNPLDKSKKETANLTDIKANLQDIRWKGLECTDTYNYLPSWSSWLTVALVTGSAAAGAVVGSLGGPPGAAIGASCGMVLAGLIRQVEKDTKYSVPVFNCVLNKTNFQPVIVEIENINSTVNKIKVPGIMDEIDLAKLNENDYKYYNLFYRPATVLTAKITQKTTNDAGVITTKTYNVNGNLPTIDAKLGDKLSFEITTDSPNPPYFGGLPSVWIARTAGEVLYYCSPSINPGEYKPFLGFDAQVHGTAIRKYPDEWHGKIKENDWVRPSSSTTGTGQYKFTWTYIASREMDAVKTTYTPAKVWKKSSKDIPNTNPVLPQRDNQREGMNMELLAAYSNPIFVAKNFPNMEAISPELPKYIFQMDPDEIIYGNSIYADTETNIPIGGLAIIKDEPWKKIYEDINKPALNLMVDAYRDSKSDLNKPYEGYEIQDEGTGTVTSSVYAPEGTGRNVKAPGLVTIGCDGMQIQFKMNVKNQFAEGAGNNRGFYGRIIGTQWPAINEKFVPYTFTGFRGVNKKLIENMYIQYEHENELGELIIDKKSPASGDRVTIAGGGTYKVNFDMQGWGYNSITAYYNLDPNDPDCKAVPIAGKELMDIGLRFVNIDNGKYVDPKDGAYIYLDSYYDKNVSSLMVQKFGKHLDRYNREYTFKKEDKINVTIFDSDPHTFNLPIDPKKSKEEGLCQPETDFYSSERTRTKRIPSDTLSNGTLRTIRDFDGKVVETGTIPFLRTYLTPLDSKEQVYFGMKSDDNGSIIEKRLLFGTGNMLVNKDIPNSNKGALNELESVYRNTSSVTHLINVENYWKTTLKNGGQIAETPIGKIETTSLENQILAVNLDTLKLINKTLKLDLAEKDLASRYILAQTRFIYSETMFGEGGNYKNDGCGLYEDGSKPGVWPRNYTTINHKNRFAKYNDFNYRVVWYIADEDNTNERVLSNIERINTFRYNYFNTVTDIGYKSWYPQDWIRHFSDKEGYPLDMATVPGDETKLSYLSDNPDALVTSIFGRKRAANNLPESWQVRLPWIAWTPDGPRTRTNIKTILDRNAFFDTTNGAFSGNPIIPGNNYDDYKSRTFQQLFTDDQNLAKNNYYEFNSGRRIIFDAKAINTRNTTRNYLLKAYLVDPNNALNKKLIDCKYIKLGPDPQAMPTPFYYGADLSYVNQLEDRGTVFKSEYKQNPAVANPTDDVFDQFSKTGHNIVRVRLWNNPKWVQNIYKDSSWKPAGKQNAENVPLYSSIDDVIKTIRRTKAAGMQVLLNIQYSDVFTDPEKYFAPDSFSDATTIGALETKVRDYTLAVFNRLKSEKVSSTDNRNLLPDMVQIGNEINIGMFFEPSAKIIKSVEDSKDSSGKSYYTHPVLNDSFPQAGISNDLDANGNTVKVRDTPENYIKFGRILKSGMNAVREFYSDGKKGSTIPIMLHIANTKDLDYIYSCIENRAMVTDCDVIGISYYPFDSPGTSVINLGNIISYIRNKYKKNVIIVETGETWTNAKDDSFENGYPGSVTDTPQRLLDYMAELKSQVKRGGGFGLFYWAPEMVSNKNFRDLWGVGSSRENTTFYGFRTPDNSDIHIANIAITWPYYQRDLNAKKTNFDVQNQVADVQNQITEVPAQAQGMILYPNPATTQFTLQFDKPVSNATLQLISTQGKVLDYAKLNDNAGPYTVTLSNFLPSGIYLVRVTTNQGIYKKALIIKK